MSVPTYAVYRDEKWYGHPDSFGGFRFTKSGSLKSQGDAFPAFGYGRHAWSLKDRPSERSSVKLTRDISGGAFGLVVMKLLLANLILKYDLEELLETPVDRALINYLVPDLNTVIRVRKRSAV